DLFPSENSMGVGIPKKWVHVAYRFETWAHVYSFKVNPCNGREMWPVVESTTFIIPPLYKHQVGRPPKTRKKLHDDIASESCSSGKLSRKGKSIKCSKCGNLGHNRKGCRSQGGASQAGGSSQAGARQVVGSRNVFGQAASARNASSQAGGSSQLVQHKA
ncbi:mutator type transposase, partial [Tanacetum coccineum]